MDADVCKVAVEADVGAGKEVGAIRDAYGVLSWDWGGVLRSKWAGRWGAAVALTGVAGEEGEEIMSSSSERFRDIIAMI